MDSKCEIRDGLCEFCGKTYKMLNRLMEHQRSTHNLKDSDRTCEVCGKIFKNTKSIRRHMNRQHFHPDKKIACKFCNYTLLEKNINKHMLICIPQQCPICGEFFIRKSSLKNHINTHSQYEK